MRSVITATDKSVAMEDKGALTSKGNRRMSDDLHGTSDSSVSGDEDVGPTSGVLQKFADLNDEQTIMILIGGLIRTAVSITKKRDLEKGCAKGSTV